jgi:hypothetical protein
MRMKKSLLVITILLLVFCLSAANDLRLNGLNETTYIYRTAKDSLNSYFRDAFSFSLGYGDFIAGVKFLAELPKYSTDQTQLMDELTPSKLSLAWTERFIEFERDRLLLHGGTISESFGSGMVFRSWQDLEFDTDTRLDGLLVKYSGTLKLKALYGALPNRNQPDKYDLVYGADAEYPLASYITMGASALTLRTLTAFSTYNQQDVFGGRLGLATENMDGGVEYAVTSLMKNSGANHEGKAVNAYTNFYLKPAFLKSLTLGAGYKFYDNFQYRTQDLKTNNYHNETLADNQTTGADEEGLQGSFAAGLTENLAWNVSYAEAWNSAFSKRMNDFYTDLEWQLGTKSVLLEFSHTEKLDKTTDHWQQDLKPSASISMPLNKYSLTVKGEYQYIEKTTHDITGWHYEPLLQVDLGMGKVSVSASAESNWKYAEDITKGRYWANCEVKYALFEHTDLTLFGGREAGGKVCRNGVCRYVAPFQGIKAEIMTRF